MIIVSWDGKPVHQSFGACNIIADGVALMDDGREYRINATATRGARKPEVTLRYMAAGKRGNIVPESAMRDVRKAALDSFAALLAPIRAEIVRHARDREAAWQADLAAPIPSPTREEGRACSWNELTGYEQSEAISRGFSRDRGTLYVPHKRYDQESGELSLSRYIPAPAGIEPKQVGTIDLTPAWRSLVPVLVAAIQDGTATGRQMAVEELYRLADFADKANAG